jgi:hypothetical protein
VLIIICVAKKSSKLKTICGKKGKKKNVTNLKFLKFRKLTFSDPMQFIIIIFYLILYQLLYFSDPMQYIIFISYLIFNIVY